MRILITSVLSFTLFMAMGFQTVQRSPKAVPQAPSNAKPKPGPAPKAPQEQYDPEHLGPGEVACGRVKPGQSNPCKCIEHRVRASEAAQLQCELVPDRKERAKCMVLNEVCSIVPVDVDHSGYDNDTGERMPAQCKRSCTKARCECCTS